MPSAANDSTETERLLEEVRGGMPGAVDQLLIRHFNIAGRIQYLCCSDSACGTRYICGNSTS